MPVGGNLISANACVNASGAAVTLQLLLSWVTGGVPLFAITKLKYCVDLNSSGLNGNSSHEILYFKMKREAKLFFLININKTFVEIHRNEPSFNSVPWESVPGGTQSLGSRLNLNGNSLQGSWSIIAPWFLGINYNATLADEWGFLPVTSALDIQNPPSQFGQYFYALYGQNGSTATRYIAQGYDFASQAYNINHTNFTARNSKWIYNEMENGNNTEANCEGALECYSSSISMSGPELICIDGSATYTVNVPIGASASWQASIPSFVTITPLTQNGSQVLVTNEVQSGQSSITATIILNSSNNVCVTGGSNTFTVSKNIVLGLPGANSLVPYITQGGNTTYMSNYCNRLTNLCSSALRTTGSADGQLVGPMSVSPYNYCATGYITDATATSITWSLLQKSSGTFHGYYQFAGNQFSVGINANYPNEWVVLRCTRTNACGSSVNDYKFYANSTCVEMVVERTASVVSSSQLLISPNPSYGEFIVTLANTDNRYAIREIVVKDKLGLPVYRRKYADNLGQRRVTLPFSSTNVYMVSVFDGKEWLTTSVTVRR